MRINNVIFLETDKELARRESNARTKRSSKVAAANFLQRQKARERILNKFHAIQAEELDGFDLTEREKAIAFYVLNGFANARIASLLRLTESTVKMHVGNLLHKCNVDSRQEFCWMMFCKTHREEKYLDG